MRRNRCGTLLVALAVDALVGELPNRLHLVVWMGHWLKLGERCMPAGNRARLMLGASWPMAAIAGALDTTLTKRDHYSVGDGGHIPDAAMLREARQLARVALGCLVIALAIGARGKQ